MPTRSLVRLILMVCLAASGARSWADTPGTFAQRLAASQAARRALDVAAIRATTGRVIYVRTAGSDGNDGSSPARAFRTIARGIAAVTAAGSVVVAGPGSYGETLNFTSATRSGTASSPNMLFADVGGALTGDAPGDVVISGAGSRAYGALLDGCNYWTFKWATFSGQTTGNISINPSTQNGTPAVRGLVLDGCTFAVTPYVGVLANYTADLTINDCTFVRGAGSGCAAYCSTIASSRLTVTGNRLNRTGSAYASTPFRSGGPDPASNFGNITYSGIVYGIVALVNGGTPSTVTIQNNVVSDAYGGIVTYAYSGGHTFRVVNNTVTACYYGLYTYGSGLASSVVSNNLIGNCYLGSYTGTPQGRIMGQMEWSINYLTTHPSFAATYASTYRTVSSSAGFISDQTPTFISASGGDFTLTQGSAGMDAGDATYAPSGDAAGSTRPLDGDANGTRLVDFGAVEAPFLPRLRVVRWRPAAAGA